MPDNNGGVVKTLQSKDSTQRVLIFRRSDGHYSISAQRWWPASHDPPAPPIPAHWGPFPGQRGIYANLEIAEEEAYALYPWTRAEDED